MKQKRKLEQGYISRTHSDFEEEDDVMDAYNEQLAIARTEIERHIEAILITTYAALSRRYPEWAHMLDDVLTSSDKIAYDNSQPAPSKVHYKDPETIRVAEVLGFNNQSREQFEKMIESRKKGTKKTKDAKKVERLFEVAA
jgi:hypothetical protein